MGELLTYTIDTAVTTAATTTTIPTTIKPIHAFATTALVVLPLPPSLPQFLPKCHSRPLPAIGPSPPPLFV